MKGIAASAGIATGKVYLFNPQMAVAQKRTITDTESEIVRLNAARFEAKSQIRSLHAKAMESLGEHENAR